MSAVSDDFKIWEGFYGTYDEASKSAVGGGFASDAWIERSRRRLRDIAADPQENLLATSAYLLPVVAALLGRMDSPLKILDYGGGPATGFQSLAAARGISKDFEYHIVDNPKVIALARECIGDDARLHVHKALPRWFPVDLVHLGSCVQYVADLDGLLGELAAFEPRAMLFSDVFAGESEGYWTLQNLWGSRVPFHFMRETDFVATVERYGVKLRICVPYIAPILGKTGPLPMDNFPPERRIKRANHYLFMRP